MAPKVIEYKPFHNGAFKARASSAQLQDASTFDLLGGGYLLLGYMDLRQNIRSCYDDSSCVTHSSKPPVVDELLLEAARRGGDVVTLLEERDLRERTSKTECSGFYATTTMVDGKPIVTTSCLTYKTTNGTIEAKSRIALVWRHEPNLSVDDANAAAIEKALQTLEAVAKKSATPPLESSRRSNANRNISTTASQPSMEDEGSQRLFAALRYNDSYAIKAMAQSGTLQKWTDDEGRTPLMVALVYERSDAALTLANIEPELGRVDRKGKNTLMYAAMLGDRPVFDRLLAAGYDVKALGPDNTPLLFYAIVNPDAAVLEYLISSGADVRAQDANGNTALMLAAEFGRMRLVKKLLVERFVVDQRNKFGQTALMLAARGDQPEVAQLLLKSGANARNADYDKQSVLHYAAYAGSVDVIRDLIAKGAILNAEDKEGRTALIESLASRQWNAAEVLIESGAALTTKRVKAEQICYILLENNQTGLLNKYASAQPDLRKQWAANPAWLHFAAMEGGAASVNYLLDLGAKIDAPANDSVSPLMAAATKGNVESVRALLKRKADTSRRDARNRTALEVAKQLKHDTVVTVMQEFGVAD